MKYIVLYLTLLMSYIGLSKEYYITYTTTEDQINVKEATIKIVPINGDSVRLLIISDNKVMYELTGILNENNIKITPNTTIETGYLYKHLDKLRGSLFINNPNYRCFILLIREK